MPGQQLYSFWEGNRSQLLATHILSSVAAVVTVPREFDFGLDLLCTLTSHEGRALHAGRAFGVQVKSVSDPVVKYGGLNERKEWKKYEVKWLYSQDQPIILCIVDLKSWRIKLYSTVRMWYLHYQIGPVMPGEVVLVPDLDFEEFERVSSQDRFKDSSLEKTKDGSLAGNGYSYRVPLGEPIVDILISDEETKEYRKSLRDCLNFWVGLDYRNIRHVQMGIPYTEEGVTWEPNVVPGQSKFWHYWNPTPEENIGVILKSISPAIASLLNNLRIQKQEEKLKSVIPIARLIKNYGFLDSMGLKALQESENLED